VLACISNDEVGFNYNFGFCDSLCAGVLRTFCTFKKLLLDAGLFGPSNILIYPDDVVGNGLLGLFPNNCKAEDLWMRRESWPIFF